MYIIYRHGGLAEWSKAVDLKSIEAQASRGSNPLPSAILGYRRDCQETAFLSCTLADFKLSPYQETSCKIPLFHLFGPGGNKHTLGKIDFHC